LDYGVVIIVYTRVSW